MVGPTIRDQAVVYDDLASVSDLPRDWSDEQDGGRYRLVRRDDDALFGYAVGPHSSKKFLHPPVQRLWRAERNADGVRAVPGPTPAERFALLESAPARCMRSRFRTGSSSVARTSIYTTERSAAALSLSRSIPARPAAPGLRLHEHGPQGGRRVRPRAQRDLDERKSLFLVEAGSDSGRAVLAE